MHLHIHTKSTPFLLVFSFSIFTSPPRDEYWIDENFHNSIGIDIDWLPHLMCIYAQELQCFRILFFFFCSAVWLTKDVQHHFLLQAKRKRKTLLFYFLLNFRSAVHFFCLHLFKWALFIRTLKHVISIFVSLTRGCVLQFNNIRGKRDIKPP